MGSSVQIHPNAYVEPGAELGTGVIIEAGAIVGEKVKLGDGVRIGASAVISGRTTIGRDTRVFPMATVGSQPQDLKYRGEDSSLEIGERNQIREYVNISLGTEGGGGKTVIGDNNLLMVYVHVGHDCQIGHECILANGVQLAGHVILGNRVVFGGLSAAHQFSQFGDCVMVAGGGMVSQDVPPYCLVAGNHARPTGLNLLGLKRAGIKNISEIKAMYSILFNENLTLEDAKLKIRQTLPESEQKQEFLAFLDRSQRGLAR